MKLITTTSWDTLTEHWGKTLREVLKEVGKTDTVVKLVRLDDDGGIGHVFHSEAVIGNAQDGLTEDDYYRAYDKLF